MFPIATSVQVSRFPGMVMLVAGACIAVFMMQVSLPGPAAHRFLAYFALIPARYNHPEWAMRHGLDPDNFLPLMTSVFLHGGWFHLIVNMWTLWLFGPAVEQRLGSFRFLLFYLIAGIFASVAQMTVLPDSTVPTIGASGAIAGVLAAHASLHPQAHVRLLVPIVFIPLFPRLPAWLFLILWFGLQLVQGAGAAMGDGGSGGGVAWWAHIGGFLAGLILIRFLAPPQPARMGPWG